MHNNIKAIIFVLFQGAAVSLIMMTARLLSEDYSPFLLMFWQNIFACSFLLIYILVTRKKLRPPKAIKLYSLRTILGIMGGTSLFWGVSLIDFNTATAITFTAPLFASVFAIIFLKEPLNLNRTIPLLIGFVGVLVVLQPTSADFNPKGLVLVGTAIIWGFMPIIIKLLTRVEEMFEIFFYSMAFMAIASIPLGIIFWKTPDTTGLMLFALLGLLHVTNYIFLVAAFKLADITLLMPFDFVRLILSTVIAWFVFTEVMGINVAIGSTIIILSNIYAAHRAKQRAKRLVGD